MAYTFDQFCKDCRESLLGKPGAAGRAEIVDHLKQLLANPKEVESRLDPDPKPGRYLAYHDDETDMNVLLHVSKGGMRIPPHDHGESWAVYGVVRGSSEIEEWERLDDGSVPGKAEIRMTDKYTITPGQAKLYHDRMIHTTNSAAGTILVRVTGTDLDAIETLGFNPETGVVRARSAGGGKPAAAGAAG